jgi:hypothetical protein
MLEPVIAPLSFPNQGGIVETAQPAPQASLNTGEILVVMLRHLPAGGMSDPYRLLLRNVDDGDVSLNHRVRVRVSRCQRRPLCQRPPDSSIANRSLECKNVIWIYSWGRSGHGALKGGGRVSRLRQLVQAMVSWLRGRLPLALILMLLSFILCHVRNPQVLI